MALADLETVIRGGLDIPIGRKTYTVAEPTAREGIRLMLMFHDPSTNLSDAEELAEIKRLLGPVWDQMNDDNVGWSKMMHAGRTALFKYGLGDENAQTYWTGGLEALGKGLNPLPKESILRTGRVYASVAKVDPRVVQERTARKMREAASTSRRLASVVGTSISRKRRRTV